MMIRPAELAARLGSETQPWKTDVRKLKEKGLTESLAIGYRLSPRGAAVLDEDTRALTAQGITSLEPLDDWSVARLSALHEAQADRGIELS